MGDQNRSYPVRLGCIVVDPADPQAATDWLRQRLPRRTRVNLRPLGADAGVLISQVSLLPGGEDLGSGLVEAGLASRPAKGEAPAACQATSLTVLSSQAERG